jgi:L-amino acid N-acyltransferase YncA
LDDLKHDSDIARLATNLQLAKKYPLLADMEPLSDLLVALDETFHPLSQGSNDDLDLRVLTALWKNAVHYLITDDVRLRKRAVRADLGDRVFTLAEAKALLAWRATADITPPPAVMKVRRYELDHKDSLFDSLREDYPGFDKWFSDPSKSQRLAWVIRQEPGGYAGLMIFKDIGDNEFVSVGKVMKVSTFKVVEDARGRNYGELLLKTLFLKAKNGGWDNIFVTVFAKHTRLVNLFSDFGFEAHPERSKLDELVLVKSLRPDSDNYQPLGYHVRFGPPQIKPGSPVFLVPIVPAWHDILFPDWDAGSRLDIDESHRAYGNSLRKAYVCLSGTRKLGVGSTVVFYRSQDRRAATVVGVVEAIQVSSDPYETYSFVSRRTVQPEDINNMLSRGRRPLLAVLFRQDRLLDPPWPLTELTANGVASAAPQSITEVKGGGKAWIHSMLAA